MFLFSSFGKKEAASPPPTPSPQPPKAHAAKHDAAEASPTYQRAAALTYYSAPYPADITEGVFAFVMLLAADKVDVDGSASVDSRADGGSGSGWFGRAWKHVTDYTAAHLLKARQDDFLAGFSRQLELNPAEESSVVMASCHCFIVSNGKPHYGTLYATNCGLYFCAAVVEAAKNANTSKTKSGSTSSGNGVAIEAAAEGTEFIKERVLYTDMASFLPSIFLEQRGGAPPFIQGIPSGVVVPTALQIFTVRRSTVLQFVGLHDLVVKPPRKSAAEREKAGADAVQDAPCTDVVRKREHELIGQLPSKLNTLTFCALLWRLWTERLKELGRPLENPAARYAEPF